MTAAIVIKKGREKPILQQHPWIFSGAIDSVQGNPPPGDIVTVKAQDGRFLARGYWNPKSQIQVRILTWQDEDINDDWWRKMLKRAIDARLNDEIYGLLNFVSALRLVNAENDFIPGLIVDKYDSWLVLQALTLGIDQRKELIAQVLGELLSKEDEYKLSGIYERSDVDVRRKEGLPESTGVLWGQEPSDYVVINEYRANFLVDVRKGHKTGFYLDQRENRSLLCNLLMDWALLDNRHGQILNLFSYTGGFGIRALNIEKESMHPVHAVNVDASAEALELAEENMKLNDIPPEKAEFIQADVFQLLRDYAAENKQFDVVILDPPKFAHNAGQVAKASRGYKDINLNAFKCVKPGGYLMTFSCSGAISADLFQKIVFGALADSGRQAQILNHLGPGDDHPVALTFPEGAYLKGLLLRVY
jgi:23S rRNA (cytosine1962-C5)-methyltransferase